MSNIEPRVQLCYETAPFPNILQTAVDFESTIRSGVEWTVLNWKALGFNWEAVHPSSVLCAGCGTGEEAIILSRLFPDASIHAIDISEPSLVIAESNAKRASAKNIVFQKSSIMEDISLHEKKYDLVYCSGVIHHLSDPQEGCNILSNSIVNNGHMIFSLYNTYGLFGYRMRIKFLDCIAGPESINRIKWTLRLGFHDGKNKASLWDSFVHPQVRTYTIEQVRMWASAHSHAIIGISPPLTLQGLFHYALHGQRFAHRRRWLFVLTLRILKSFFGVPYHKDNVLNNNIVNVSRYRDIFFQLIFFLLGKGECFYIIKK